MKTLLTNAKFLTFEPTPDFREGELLMENGIILEFAAHEVLVESLGKSCFADLLLLKEDLTLDSIWIGARRCGDSL